MDNAGKAKPTTGIDNSSENHDVGIPKVNVKFDGHSWTNQNPQNCSTSTSAALTKISSENVAAKSSLQTEVRPSLNSNASIDDNDQEFDLGEAGDYDDEETLEEEEAADDGEGDAEELDDLAKEGAMPINDLLALYYNRPDNENVEYNSNDENQSKSFSNEDKNEDSDENEDLTRQLRSSTSFLSPNHHQSADEEDDRDYVPPVPDDWKKVPRVGDGYQADNIPEANHQSPDYNVDDDQMMWDPSLLDEERVQSYLKDVGQTSYDANVIALPSGSHLRDNEDALLLLKQCNSDTEEAAKQYRLQPSNYANELPVWTEEECKLFEQGLAMYGKDFHLIHRNRLSTKSIGEIVKFYYIWKKTERYDHFSSKTRLGKKKDPLHPGVTDYMERLLDETEHAIASQHSNHSNAPCYPPTLSHTAALQQHLADVRMTRRQNRQHLQNNYDTGSPITEYSEMNGLVDGDYPDEMDVLDGIVPTLSANHIYPQVPFAPINPALNNAFSDRSQFAPIISTNHHPELVHVAPFAANQNNNCHVLSGTDSSQIQVLQSADDKRKMELAATSISQQSARLHADGLSSTDELDTAYSSSAGSSSSTSLSSNSLPIESSASVDSDGEKNKLDLKRFHCPDAGEVDDKKRKVAHVYPTTFSGGAGDGTASSDPLTTSPRTDNPRKQITVGNVPAQTLSASSVGNDTTHDASKSSLSTDL